MNNLLSEQYNGIFTITFNRIAKHNAFDEIFLKQLQQLLDEAQIEITIRVIIIKANGKAFSAGADIAWMRRTANYNLNENIDDALILAKVIYTIHHSNKPIIAIVNGIAYGGGAGLVAACDIAIATPQAKFCFSEVRLGLVPAIISPYVIKAIGARHAQCLFISAEIFDACRAYELGLVHYCIPQDELEVFIKNYVEKLLLGAPQAVSACKQLINIVNNQPITDSLIQKTAEIIAKKRSSKEGKQGLEAFLNRI